MENDQLRISCEEILNSLTVIYGFFQLVNTSRPEYGGIVEEEVRKVVSAVRKLCFGNRGHQQASKLKEAGHAREV